MVASEDRAPDEIREATQVVLESPSSRRNAERLRDEMHTLPGLEYAVELLERLAAEKRPLRTET